MWERISKYMNTKECITKIKKINPFGLLAIGVLAGLVIMYLYFQPKLKDLANKNQTLVSQSRQETASYTEQLASASARIQSLLNQPKPTPQVKYVTQYQTVTETAPKQTVTYYPVGNTGQSYGSDGSWCYPNGSSVYCTGGR
jgi:hypothetical protein